MKIRNPLLIRLSAFAIAGLLRLWFGTVRIRIAAADGCEHPLAPEKQRCIYALWHESLLAPLKVRSRAKVLISQSNDGELISQTCRHLGVGTVRGSTSRGGEQALLEMLGDRGDSHLLFFPDGPRGPRRKLKRGVVLMASLTGLPIVPVGVGYTRAWRGGSWDRFALPRPGSTITSVVGQPIMIPPNLSPGDWERHRLCVESALLAATRAAELWAEALASGRRQPDPCQLYNEETVSGGQVRACA